MEGHTPIVNEALVTRADQNGVTTLTLNRPEKLNALNPPLFVELRNHIDGLHDDEGICCVVLTGAGRSFCAGHDLEAIASGERAPHRYFEPETIDRLESLPMPTIAKIRGHCFTGGLELALACDLLVTAASAKLGDTHGQWGMPPVWGMTVRLPERVGRSTARELMFTSRRIDGTLAAAIGLVDHVVEDDHLDEAVDRLASEIQANSRGTNRIDKALMAAAEGTTRAEALQFERSAPFGVPDDMKLRMANGGRDPRTAAPSSS
ncbi:MAG TPA: enoyl-CoA hydratase/isomerase family protein [Acidimicrobiales bacterium]|nr:enoyl-CoA hydratase/isomerase family protein [Acidimicrobiales bacterium]